jgi:hypothetical protein
MYMLFYKSKFASQCYIPFTDYLGKFISHTCRMIGSLPYFLKNKKYSFVEYFCETQYAKITFCETYMYLCR